MFDAASSAERFRDGRTAYCSCRYPNAYVVMQFGAIHRLVSSGESVVFVNCKAVDLVLFILELAYDLFVLLTKERVVLGVV